MAEYQPPSEPVAVEPKFDCPHVDTFVTITSDQAVKGFHKSECTNCQSKYEPWLCLHCANLGCSRYVKGHASDHGENQGHAISLSFSDFSVWCYECNSYIVDREIAPILHALKLAKFPPEEKEKVQSSYFICNCCFKKISNGPRFHCEECEDFDLCLACKDGNKSSDDHKPEHKVSEHK